MARRRAPVDLHLLAKISALYHHRGLTQQEIGERFRISRPRVSQLLKEAQKRGIVQILVNAPPGVHVDLEGALEERFGLEEVVIADAEEGAPDQVLRRQLGAAAAGYLARTVEDGQAIGIAWGPTLSAMVQAVSPVPTSRVRVLQLAGGIGAPAEETYASEIVRRLAQRLSASALVLPVPGIVGTAEAAAALRLDHHVAAVLRELDLLDIAFLGIGRVRHNPVVHDGQSWIPGFVADLEKAGAVGDVLLRFFDAEGTLVPTVLDDRLVGITTEQLRSIPRLVAVAGGRAKVPAIRAALRTGLIKVLITDQLTARSMLSPGS